MSATLLRKSLELVESSTPRQTGTKRLQGEHDTSKVEITQEKKKVRKPKKTRREEQATAHIYVTAKELAIAEKRRVKENVEKLLGLGTRLQTPYGKEKQVTSVVKKVCKRAGVLVQKKKTTKEVDEKTAFSENDFKSFEKSYFGK